MSFMIDKQNNLFVIMKASNNGFAVVKKFNNKKDAVNYLNNTGMKINWFGGNISGIDSLSFRKFELKNY